LIITPETSTRRAIPAATASCATGVIAKLVTPGGEYEPKGFILTTILGVVGALVATYLGQAIGWYRAGQGAGFIGAIVGAVLILLVGS
jgi:uncharacterized membrane protein YeaQ/YmgE (transglycosylase-associated protein family)